MVFGMFEGNNKHHHDDYDDARRRTDARRETRLSMIRRKTTVFKEAILDSEKTTTSPTAVRNSFVAGWVAGVSGTIAGHPLDSLKVWVQTGIRPDAGGAATADGTSRSSGNIFSKIRRFYSGVSGPLLAVGLIQSVNFAVYDTTRRFWYFHFDNPDADPYGPHIRDYLTKDSLTSVGVAGFTAGSVVSFVTSPMLMIKTMQQTAHQKMKFQNALTIVKHHPTTGFGLHFMIETINRSIYFTTYEYIKRHFEQKARQEQQLDDDFGDGRPPKMSLAARMVASFAAGINCTVWVYPMDALRSRIYATMAKDTSINAMTMARVMYTENGLRSFSRGFAVTTFRAGPVAAAILPVYDYTLDTLNSMS